MKNLKTIFLSLFCVTALVSCGTKPATYHRSTSSVSPLNSIIEATTEVESSNTNIDESSISDDTSFELIIETSSVENLISIEDKKGDNTYKIPVETNIDVDSSNIDPTITTTTKASEAITSQIKIDAPVSDIEEASSWIVVEKPIEETTTTTEFIDENPNIEIDNYSYQLLAEIVWHEAGSDWISLYDKAHIAAAVMNRVYDSRFPNTVYDVLIAPGQFTGYWPGSCVPTQECYDAVNYYLANPYDFDETNSWWGDGNQNYFYYQ